MIRTQRQLTKEQSQTLKAVAAELQSSVAALVRESIADLPIQTAAVTFPSPWVFRVGSKTERYL